MTIDQFQCGLELNNVDCVIGYLEMLFLSDAYLITLMILICNIDLLYSLGYFSCMSCKMTCRKVEFEWLQNESG